MADEINRTLPKTQAALLEAMQEKRVTSGGVDYELAKPFLVLATQNPIEQEGTYPLPEVQLEPAWTRPSEVCRPQRSRVPHAGYLRARISFKGTWRFEGLEEEEPLITQPERIRTYYLNSFNSYLETIRTGCIGSGIDYAIVDTSRPLDTVLGEFMDRRASAFAGASAGARQ